MIQPGDHLTNLSLSVDVASEKNGWYRRKTAIIIESRLESLAGGLGMEMRIRQAGVAGRPDVSWGIVSGL